MKDSNDYVRHYQTKQRIERLIKKGLCPRCEIRMTSKFHTDCPEVINKPKS